MRNNKLINQIFIESSRQHFLVMYVLSPIFTIVILNEYFFKNLLISVFSSIFLFLIYHLLIGYRFYKRLSFKENYLRIDYNLLIKFTRKIKIPYDQIKRVELKGGYGTIQNFLKIYTSNSIKFKFVTNDWDEIIIISILKKKIENLTINNRTE